MRPLISALRRALEKLGELLQSKTALARRDRLRSEEHERETSEAERLDRLRNPRDYVGR